MENTADAVHLLGYVVPLVRFLGVRRMNGLAFEPPGLRPLPDGLRDLLAAVHKCLLPAEPDGSVTLCVSTDEPAWWVEQEEQVDAPQRHPFTLSDQPCPAAFGLSEFLAGVWYAPLGQLVLADWLEDRFGPSALETALRASEPEPVLNYDYGTVVYDAFRWRWLEPDVICYFSRCTADRVAKKKRYAAGHVLGLLHRGPDAVVRRSARWVRDDEIAGRLAASMGVELPEDAATQVW